MKQYLIPFAAALACGSAFAADPFIGPSAGISLGYTDSKVEYSGMLTGTTSDSDFAGKLRAAYGFAMSKDWVGAIGIGYQLNKVKFGDGSYVDGGTRYRVSAKLKNDLELSFAPGYRITADALVYAKVGYHRAKGEYHDAQIGAGETTHNGVGVGVGYLKSIGSNLSIGIEAEHIEYSRESANLTSGKPKQDAINLVLNYRF